MKYTFMLLAALLVVGSLAVLPILPMRAEMVVMSMVSPLQWEMGQ